MHELDFAWGGRFMKLDASEAKNPIYGVPCALEGNRPSRRAVCRDNGAGSYECRFWSG
jgi:hypothetical protein